MPVLIKQPDKPLTEAFLAKAGEGFVDILKAAARFEELAKAEAEQLCVLGELTLDEAKLLANKAGEIWLQSAVESLVQIPPRPGAGIIPQQKDPQK